MGLPSRRCYRPGAEGREKWKVLSVLLTCWFLFPANAEAQLKEVRRVLVFYEMGLASPAVTLVDQEIRAALEESPYQIELYREYLETTLFPDEASQQKFREWYIQKYQGRRPDLIIAVGPSPIRFMADSHKRYFQRIPVVFCGSSENEADNPKLDSDFTGVWEAWEPSKTLEMALKLRPRTEHVVVVGGVTSFDRHLEALVKEDLRKMEGTLDFTYLTDLQMPALVERLKHLPDRSIVFFTDLERDAAGTHFISATQSASMVVNAANAPVLSLSDVNIGHGEVGGYVDSFDQQGQIVGGMARRILAGEKPQDIPVAKATNLYMFDWRALQRWGIRESDLPPGSILLYRQPTAWEAYKRYIIGAVSLCLLQTLLVLGLLWQRARRTRIETALRESEERFRRMASTAPVLIWMAGTDKLCTYFNKPWLDFTGKALESELGSGWSEGVHPADRSVCLDTYSQAFDRRERFRMEYRLRRHDGEYRWVLDIGVPRFHRDGSFAGYIGSAIDITDHKNAEEAQRSVSRRLIEAQEEERRFIARELHDDVNQLIALLAIEVQKLQDALPASSAALRSQTAELSKRTLELSGEVQALSHRLHSSKLELLGVVAAMKSFCSELTAQHGVEISFAHRDVPRSLPREVSLCLFRVLQEALRNAIRHSGVRRFEADLRGANGEILLTVRDFGAGFDVEEIMNNRQGLGLVSMQERVNLVQGTISITSEPGAGTLIDVRVPIAMGVPTTHMIARA